MFLTMLSMVFLIEVLLFVVVLSLLLSALIVCVMIVLSMVFGSVSDIEELSAWNLNLLLVKVNGDVWLWLLLCSGRCGSMDVSSDRYVCGVVALFEFDLIVLKIFSSLVLRKIEMIVGGVLLAFRWWFWLVVVIDVCSSCWCVLIVWMIVV